MAITNKDNSQQEIKLSIQVSLDGLSFCALDRAAQKIIFFREKHFSRKLNPMELLEQIKALYEEESFLSEHSGEVELLFRNELYALVPKKLFSAENASDYLKFNAKILQTDFVAQDYIGEALVNVYIPYTNLTNFFFDIYGEFQYRHSTSVFIEELLKLGETTDGGVVFYANKHRSGFDLVVIEDGKLLLANSFHCETPEDFIYYLLFTAEQLEKDPESFQLVLLGDISPEGEPYKIAYSYIRHIQIMEISFGYIFEGRNTPPKGFQHFTLLKTLQ